MTDQPERTHRFIPPHIFWPGLVVCILGISFTFAGVTMYVAMTDPSFSVEPDYYQKALDWDQTARQRELNEQLAWAAAISVGDAHGPLNLRDLTMTLTDDQGDAIENARVTLHAFHHARRNESLDATLEAGDGAGVYSASMPIKRDGLWEFRLVVDHDGRRFTSDQQLWVSGKE